VDPRRASIWVTGSDGRYRVAGVVGGKLAVLARAQGFAEARSKVVTIAPGEVAANVDIVLGAGTNVVGRVVDQHGAPIVGAEIVATPELGVAIATTTDADGAYRLGPLVGAIELRATAYGHVDVKKKLELAQPRGGEPGDRREDLVLELADAIL